MYVCVNRNCFSHSESTFASFPVLILDNDVDKSYGAMMFYHSPGGGTNFADVSSFNDNSGMKATFSLKPDDKNFSFYHLLEGNNKYIDYCSESPLCMCVCVCVCVCVNIRTRIRGVGNPLPRKFIF